MRTWRTDMHIDYPDAPPGALVHGGFFYSYNSSALAQVRSLVFGGGLSCVGGCFYTCNSSALAQMTHAWFHICYTCFCTVAQAARRAFLPGKRLCIPVCDRSYERERVCVGG